jgi:RNA polymerase sigma-70 factor (ECF subfamily)
MSDALDKPHKEPDSSPQSGADAAEPCEYQRLFLLCAKSLHEFIHKTVRDPDDAEEVFQELSLKVLLHRSGPSNVEQFAAWCRGVLRHTLADHFRAKSRRTDLVAPVELESGSFPAGKAFDPESALSTRELLRRAFESVDERSHDLLLKRYLLGESANEIADGVAMSPSAVRVRLMRARSVLRRKRTR